MKLRTDTIGHFESPTEDIIRDAVAYSGEGAHEGDLVKSGLLAQSGLDLTD